MKLADLGDVLTVSPALRAMRESYPEARIHLLTAPAGEAALGATGLVDRIIPFDKFRYDKPLGALRSLDLAIRLAIQLRQERYDRILLFHHLTTRWGALKFAALAKTVGGRSTGLDNGRGWFLDERVIDRGFGAVHEVEYWLEVAVAAGATIRETGLAWHIAAEDRETADRLLGDSKQPTVAIYPGSGSYSVARRWPVDRFVEVGKRLAASGFRVIAVGTEIELTSAVAAGIGPSAIDLGGKTSVGQVTALLSRCVMLIGNDGGVTHLAAAVGTPVVAIFGPSNDRAWAPWNPLGNTVVVRHNLPCSPCFYRGTGLGNRFGCPARTCLDLVTVEEVTLATGNLMNRARETTDLA